MAPLTRLLSVIRSGDSITLTMKRTPECVQVIVQPIIAKADDPDPQLAQLRALLATPFYFTIPNGGDADAALDQHVAASADSRIAVISAEDNYLAAVNAAVENSRKAALAKSAKATKPATKLKAPVTVSEASDESDDTDDADDAPPTPAEAPPAAATPAAAPNLLSDLDL